MPAGTRAAEPLDLVIVGAGPCGLAAAVAAHRAGLSYALLDRDCLVSAIVGYPYYMTFFSTADKLAIGGIPFTIGGEKPTRREALAYYRNVAAHAGVHVDQFEDVERLEQEHDLWIVHARPRGGATRARRARAVVIATGYFGRPNRLGVPGEQLPHVSHDFREGHAGFDQDVVVVGGGNSAAEAALDLYRAGARVQLVHMFPELDKGIKPWVAPDLRNRIADGSIRAHFEAQVTAIEWDAVRLETPSGEERLPASLVYLLIGYTPDTRLLEQAGVTIDPDTGVPAHDPTTMETDVPGIFIAGVLASGYDANKIFIENGREHGDRIAAHLSGAEAPAVPSPS